jgi:hypothetical protein
METAPAFIEPDADMKKISCMASALSMVLATLALNGCGADDTAPASNASTTAPAANDTAQPSATAAAAILDASAPSASNTANHAANLAANNPANNAASNAASGAAATTDPITQNMQAVLAADSRQVAPVMRYAPGDSANN